MLSLAPGSRRIVLAIVTAAHTYCRVSVSDADTEWQVCVCWLALRCSVLQVIPAESSRMYLLRRIDFHVQNILARECVCVRVCAYVYAH